MRTVVALLAWAVVVVVFIPLIVVGAVLKFSGEIIGRIGSVILDVLDIIATHASLVVDRIEGGRG